MTAIRIPAIAFGVSTILLCLSAGAAPEDAPAAEPLKASAGVPKSETTVPEPPWHFSVSAEIRYMSGDFQTGHTITIDQYSATFTAKRGRFDASVTSTYLNTKTTGTGSVASFRGGSPFFQQRGQAGRAGRDDTFQDTSGVGDTFVEAGYLAAKQRDLGVDTRLSGGVKLPTADDKKGLGTGQTDVFVGAEFTRWEGDNVGVLRLGKTFMGDTTTTDFQNPWDAALGVGHRFHLEDGDAVEPRLWLRGREAALRGASDPAELAATVEYDRKKVFFTAELAGGLTPGAPDVTVALGIGYDF